MSVDGEHISAPLTKYSSHGRRSEVQKAGFILHNLRQSCLRVETVLGHTFAFGFCPTMSSNRYMNADIRAVRLDQSWLDPLQRLI